MRIRPRKKGLSSRKTLIRQRVKIVPRRRRLDKEKEGRRILRILMVGLLVLALVGGLVALGIVMLFRDPRFTVENIRVINNYRVPYDVILQRADKLLGKNIFRVDIQGAVDRVKQDPLIKGALIRRRLPNTIEIKVYEREPVARVRTAGRKGFWLEVDEYGIVTGQSEKPRDLVFISGRKFPVVPVGMYVDVPGLEKALEIAQIYNNSKVQAELNIDHLDISSSKNVVMVLGDGARIMMGKDHFEDRFGRLLAILEDLKAKNTTAETIDLRFQSVPVKTRER